MAYSDRLSGPEVGIYLFHGVIGRQRHAVRNYTRKHLEAAAFREVLLDLKGKGVPLSMEDVLGHCESGEPFPERAFAITFDDGFENNWTVAAPILEELGIPATFYVSTAYMGTDGMSWVDRIEAMLDPAPPGSLPLPWRDAPAPFVGDADKRGLLDEMRRIVKADPKLDQDALVASIASGLGVPAPVRGDDPLDKKLSWEQVRMLDEHPLFTVGGHSHAHSILAFLPDGELEKELDLSLSLLRERAGVGPRHYSYPEGLAHCFDARVIARLKERGVRCCPTAMDGTNPPGTDPFLLKRIFVV